MYNVADYGDMIKDAVRYKAYRDALERHVRPDSVVIDIGSGTGIFALLACKFGARHVYAIESTSVVEIARESALQNSISDQLTIIRSHSSEADLDEKADVVISDLRGVLPLNQDHLLTIKDARERFLKPNGILIPASDTMKIVPIEAKDWYESLSNPWETGIDGLDLSAALKYISNSWYRLDFDQSQFLAPPQIWSKIDYHSVEDPNISNENHWTISKSGTLHAVGVWFDCKVDDLTSFSNAPGTSRSVYGRAVFPLAQPEPMSVGDKLTCRLRADLIGQSYIWSWKSQLTRRNSKQTSYLQSTFSGCPRTLTDLRKRKPSYIATLNFRGEIVKRTLDLISKNFSNLEIAEVLFATYPNNFESLGQAVNCAADIAVKWGR